VEFAQSEVTAMIWYLLGHNPAILIATVGVICAARAIEAYVFRP
jgi:hypothetical protein